MEQKRRISPVISVILVLILIILALAALVGFQRVKMNKTTVALAQLTATHEQLQRDVQKQIDTAVEEAVAAAEADLRAELEAEYEEKLAALEQQKETEPTEEPTEEAEPAEPWLNLDNFPRLAVKPKQIYDAPKIKYINTRTGLNMRAGPGDNHTILTSASRGTKVEAAAIQGEWTLIHVDGQAGWAKTEFLADQKPA